jgi:flavodoxin
MRTIVIYKSISGFTKKYAVWIEEELKADIRSAKDFDCALFKNYDLIVFGGSLHAVGINGVKCIKENLEQLCEKRIVVFAVGASPPRENVLDEIRNNNFSDEEQKKIMFFYLRGGFNYSKLNFSNKILMIL